MSVVEPARIWLGNAKGLKGDTGDTGPQGEAGPKGETGDAATISVGTVTDTVHGNPPEITNSGTSGAAVFNFVIPEGATGPKGETGDTGATGATGAAATISVGSVTGTAHGNPPEIINSGTSSAAVFNFVIPDGATGPKGDTGETGATGATGAAATISVGTVTGTTHGNPPEIINSGTSSAAVFDFVIPDGATGPKGDTGETGAPGAAATISVGSVTRTAHGNPPQITNSGTSSAAVFNFVIPEGATGPKGETGDTGATGATGAAGAAATISVGSVTGTTHGNPPQITNSGTSSAAVFNFVIPDGATGPTGATGATGAPGTAATIAVGTVTEAEPGDPPQVINSGTSTAAVFDFVLPGPSETFEVITNAEIDALFSTST